MAEASASAGVSFKQKLRNVRATSAATSAANIAAIKERLKTELNELEVQQKKIESLTRDLEFTRQQYQQASTSVVELVSQNAALEKQVTVSIFLK
jgi:uncharacterized protein involved in exopolysaccharide biosynthesis